MSNACSWEKNANKEFINLPWGGTIYHELFLQYYNIIFAYSLGFYSKYAVRRPRFTPLSVRSPYFAVHSYNDGKDIRKTGEDNDFEKTIFVINYSELNTATSSTRHLAS